MSHATHANAALTPRARLRLARLIVDHGWPVARAAERYDVSWRTAKQVGRPLPRRGPGRDDRPVLAAAPPAEPDPGAGGPQDRAPALEAAARPGRDRRPAGRCRPRPCTRCWSGAGSTGSPTSTGPPASRSAATSTTTPATCSTSTSRSSARSPTAAAGATSAASRASGTGPRPRPAPAPRNKYRDPLIGTCYLHTVHRRPLPGRLRRGPRRRDQARPRPRCCATPSPGSPTAASPSSGCCPTTAAATASHLWRDTCAELGITPKRTRPYRPQTNGKIERFHRTLAEGWAFKKFYTSENSPPRRSASMDPPVQPPPAPHSDRQGQHPSPGWTTWLGSTVVDIGKILEAAQ